jgi:hypothetical protein
MVDLVVSINTLAFEGYDLTTRDAVDELKRRVDFARRLGDKIVNIKVGAASGRK